MCFLRLTGGLPCAQTVALTFDDAPDATNTARVLDALRNAGVKATFFVNTHNQLDVANSAVGQVGVWCHNVDMTSPGLKGPMRGGMHASPVSSWPSDASYPLSEVNDNMTQRLRR